MPEEHEQKTWLEKLSHALLREPQDREQLIDMLYEAKERDLLNNDALQMIEGVFQVSQMQVRDIMIPRSQVVFLEHDDTPQAAAPKIIDSTHSRFPVVGDNRDNVIGILLAKDIIKVLLYPSETPITLAELVRPATIIPESKHLDVLLKEFRSKRNHMAIVVDEYGGVSGLITIEDVLEQIVGEIEDETDRIDQAHHIKALSDDEYLVDALTPIEDFNAWFGTDHPDDELDTIGGLVLQCFGHLPKRGESTEFGDFTVTVLEASSRGVQLLRFEHKKGI